MTATIIDGAEIARQVRAEVARDVKELKDDYDVTPGLAALLLGDNPASASYVRAKGRAGQEVGIYTETFHIPSDASQGKVLDTIEGLNKDRRFHGILTQLPFPSQIDEAFTIRAIHPDKDVDCLHPYNVGLLVQGEPVFTPVMPLGVQQLLMRTGHNLAGKHVVICGRSNMVGKPLAALLAQKREGANATVTVCHTGTRNLAEFTRMADILVAAVGSPRMIKADMVKKGAIVIDVGLSRVEDPSRKQGYRLDGDVDFEAVSQVASAITPVPGGVGPMTIAMLLVNTVKAAKITIP
ncbi:MAG: tetrahydrofolate dehydrogenase/cyclohydrolase catalytic domain-containing protein [Dehalococcoidia bacterium]|nr:tetrahydrofolate dehydrogenase/cyclohydrolase catalytic domain-containing protein [Dehalococcoidia bacterium]